MSNKEGRYLVAFLRQTHHNQCSEGKQCHNTSYLLTASVINANQVSGQQIVEQYSYSICHVFTASDTERGKKRNKIKDNSGFILQLQIDLTL